MKTKLEMNERFSRMAVRTWEVLASDLASALGDEGEELTLEHAIECVGDADRMLELGDDKEAYEEFMKMDYSAQDRVLRKALKGRV